MTTGDRFFISAMARKAATMFFLLSLVQGWCLIMYANLHDWSAFIRSGEKCCGDLLFFLFILEVHVETKPEAI